MSFVVVTEAEARVVQLAREWRRHSQRGGAHQGEAWDQHEYENALTRLASAVDEAGHDNGRAVL